MADEEHGGAGLIAQLIDEVEYFRLNRCVEPCRRFVENQEFRILGDPALPTLHAKLDDFIHTEAGGYTGAHRKIFQQVRDPALRVDVPDTAGRVSRYR